MIVLHSGGDLTSSLQIQLAQVYKTKIEREGSHKTLNVECLEVQQQHGGFECGVFAIAFAHHAGMLILINLAIIIANLFFIYLFFCSKWR